MKTVYIFMLLSLSALLMSSKSYGDDTFAVLEGPYLGQKPPGLTPEVFAPGVVSAEHKDLAALFSPDLKELYFNRKDNKTKKWSTITFKSENNQWHESVVGPREGGHFISPDGKTMHLGKRYKERTNTGWSEIKSLGSPFDEIWIMRLTVSIKGTYFFDEMDRQGNGTLRYSRLIDGKREEPKPLSKEINTGTWNAHPFIAADESYIMWDGERESGFGDNDIYISFKQQDGSWGTAINLGNKINTSAQENGAYVTPDGKYLFFNRSGDIYWLDAQIIENLKIESQTENTD
jgi:hypothetical protein